MKLPPIPQTIEESIVCKYRPKPHQAWEALTDRCAEDKQRPSQFIGWAMYADDGGKGMAAVTWPNYMASRTLWFRFKAFIRDEKSRIPPYCDSFFADQEVTGKTWRKYECELPLLCELLLRTEPAAWDEMLSKKRQQLQGSLLIHPLYKRYLTLLMERSGDLFEGGFK